MIFKGQRQDLLTSWVLFDTVLWQQKDVIQKGRTLIKRITQVCTKIWNWPKKLDLPILRALKVGRICIFSLINPLVLHARIEPTGQLYWKFMSHDDTWLLLLNDEKKSTTQKKNCFSHLCRHSSCPYVRPC